eukprot:TRINITY_DN4261_c0_g1_i1.p1 TRINITY_DN4261_c0_g1~~TRINITY_DN4261_c0_g1_i1.p1  ORF type:complete len:518 (-),score=30.07 TRINITY_DN4261_c0_g1_i1:180-1733(-)
MVSVPLSRAPFEDWLQLTNKKGAPAGYLLVRVDGPGSGEYRQSGAGGYGSGGSGGGGYGGSARSGKAGSRGEGRSGAEYGAAGGRHHHGRHAAGRGGRGYEPHRSSSRHGREERYEDRYHDRLGDPGYQGRGGYRSDRERSWSGPEDHYGDYPDRYDRYDRYGPPQRSPYGYDSYGKGGFDRYADQPYRGPFEPSVVWGPPVGRLTVEPLPPLSAPVAPRFRALSPIMAPAVSGPSYRVSTGYAPEYSSPSYGRSPFGGFASTGLEDYAPAYSMPAAGFRALSPARGLADYGPSYGAGGLGGSSQSFIRPAAGAIGLGPSQSYGYPSGYGGVSQSFVRPAAGGLGLGSSQYQSYRTTPGYTQTVGGIRVASQYDDAYAGYDSYAPGGFASDYGLGLTGYQSAGNYSALGDGYGGVYARPSSQGGLTGGRLPLGASAYGAADFGPSYLGAASPGAASYTGASYPADQSYLGAPSYGVGGAISSPGAVGYGSRGAIVGSNAGVVGPLGSGPGSDYYNAY